MDTSRPSQVCRQKDREAVESSEKMDEGEGRRGGDGRRESVQENGAENGEAGGVAARGVNSAGALEGRAEGRQATRGEGEGAETDADRGRPSERSFGVVPREDAASFKRGARQEGVEVVWEIEEVPAAGRLRSDASHGGQASPPRFASSPMHESPV